jgi:hypothetical protein
MSIYDRRTTSAYWGSRANPHYCKKPQYILKWWTPSHDELLAKQIEKEEWAWYVGIVDEILGITPPEIIEAWEAEDPVCLKYGLHTRLEHFCASRARKLGLRKAIRKPKWKTCRLCNKRFVEDSLPYPLVKRLGINQLDFCAPCLKDTVLQSSGNETLSRQKVLTYLRDLANVLQRVPPQNFGEGMNDLYDLSTEERLVILQVLKRKPTVRRVKELFCSWLKALVEAGVLEDGTRGTSRGTQCLAKDGHVCLSLREKTIDDLLYALGIPHEKEPRYPEGNFRADFVVNGVFIEYFGLTGAADYDAKTRLKQRACKRHGIKLISIYPGDLVSSKKLEAKLLKGLSL